MLVHPRFIWDEFLVQTIEQNDFGKRSHILRQVRGWSVLLYFKDVSRGDSRQVLGAPALVI